MDLLAKQYRKYCEDNKIIAYLGMFKGEQFRIIHKQQRLTTMRWQYIYDKLSTTMCLKWWTNHGRFPKESISLVDWKTIGNAFHNLDSSKQQWITKHAFNNSPLGSVLYKWNYRIKALYHQCYLYKEIAKHVFQCKYITVIDLWNNNFTLLHNWFYKY